MTRAAFTLVEIAIVLVIAGLLAGGVIAGTSILRASELRAINADLRNYGTAIRGFEEKYGALPGDMPNATEYWGEQDAVPATCQATASDSALTCDGNGDGRTQDNTYEMFRFWQHLANASFIGGSFTGVPGTADPLQHIPGTNAPAGSRQGSGYAFGYLGTFAGDVPTFAGDYKHMFWFGLAGTHRPQGNTLTPAEAYAIDSKTDDGKPGMGKIMSRSEVYARGDTKRCSDDASATDFDSDYNADSEIVSCSLTVRFD